MSALKRHAFPPLLGAALSCAVLISWACASQAPSLPLNGATLEPPIGLQELSVTRSDVSTFTTADTRGRISLFFFGYTNCADVCPLTLAELTRMRRTLGSDARNVDVYFVTLDPARDTPERMRAYLENFPGVTGLIGSDAELASLQSVFNVSSERREIANGNYSLDHTAPIYLVNAASQIQLAYPSGTPAEDISSDLHQLVL
jgi:protein SCO1